MKHVANVWIVALLLICVHDTSAQNTIYVDGAAVGGNDGTSWSDAYTSLQDALASSASGDQIWVAAGVYRPDIGSGLAPGDRSLSFEMRSGVRIHGGFEGTESSKAGRDLAANKTILSADLLDNDDGLARREDNSYHVIRADNVDDDALLEGFTIVGGQADGQDADSLGGGILITGGAPWIINSRVNSSIAGCGGGVGVTDTGLPTFVSVVINGNSAQRGGGLCSMNSTPTIINATVSGNRGKDGAGMYNSASSPVILNSAISGNLGYELSNPCEIWQFPCSDSDVSEEILALNEAIMDSAVALIEDETFDDAVNYVNDHPDIVQRFSGAVSVGWRTPGSSISILMDGNALPIAPGVLGPAQKRNDFRSKGTRELSETTSDSAQLPVLRKTIIGEDWTGDGKFDNRDGKRALILDPWGFADASNALSLLSVAPGYRIEYFGPAEMRDGTPADLWGSWSGYDLIYISAFSDTNCGEIGAEVVCYNGIPTTNPWLKPETITVHFPGIGASRFPLVTSTDLRGFYSGQLENKYIHCSFCKLGNFFYEALTRAGNNSVFANWISYPEPVVPEVLADLNAELLANLVVGRRSQADVISYPAGFEFQSTPIRFGDPYPKIVELPVLLYESEDGPQGPMTDFTDVTDMIIGTIDDDQPDVFLMRQLVYGIDEAVGDTPEDLSLRFVINGHEVGQNIELGDHGPSSISEHVYFVEEMIDLPFPVETGFLDIESIVRFPNGNESQYSVLAAVNAFSCTSSTGFGGYRSGAFTGAAQWNGDETAAVLNIESVDQVLGLGPAPEKLQNSNDFNVTFFLSNGAPDSVNGGIKFDVEVATLTSRQEHNPWFFGFVPNSFECPECQASVRVDSLVEGSPITGEFEFAGWDVTYTQEERRISSAAGHFKALTGNLNLPNSDYGLCLTEYWEAYEEATRN